MYDFYFGSKDDIAKDEFKFLISIKRMMPRWVNSLPDSEFLALAKILDEQGKGLPAGKKLIAVETGAGASSLVMAFYALKYDGLAMSWDYNSEKGSLIRTVCTETMGNYFRKHIDNHWKLIGHDSLSVYLGLPILKDLVDHVDVFFHDSEHVWKTVKKELEIVMPLLSDGAVVALDDANLDFIDVNLAYINTFRKKLGLPAVPWPKENTGECFYVAAEKLLKTYWDRVEHLPDLYKEQYREDAFFAYYNAEFKINSTLGTARNENLEHRFDSWRVSARKNK